MAKITITEEQRKEMNDKYLSVVGSFKPKFGSVEDMYLARDIGRVLNNERLAKKHKGKGSERAYLNEVFHCQERVVSSINYHLKNK
jgi:hypothetical protein